jgi:hypothetical protein
MSIRVFGWDADPIGDPFSFMYCQSDRRGEEILQQQRGNQIKLPDGRFAIQLHPPTAVLLERSARNCLTPFGRVINKLMDPPTLHYPVPAEGDHRQRWQNRFMTPADRPQLQPA